MKQRTAQLYSLQGLIGCHAGLRLRSRQVKQLKQDDLAHCFESADTFFAAQQTRQLIQQLNTRLEAMQAFVLRAAYPQTISVMVNPRAKAIPETATDT